MPNTDVSVDVDFLAKLPAKTILRLADKKKDSERAIKLMATTVQELAPMFLTLEEMDIDISFDLNCQSIDIGFSGNGDKFQQVWGMLRHEGYTPDTRPVAGDTGYCGFWRKSEHWARIYLRFSSTVCKRVQIGTKMIEQAIYETQCSNPIALEQLT